MSATGGVNMLPMVGNCVSLSWQILQLLLVSKGNKHEHKSLQSALTNIHRFLQAIPFDGVTAEGNEVLKQLHAQLLQVHQLLVDVKNMSTLVALIKANAVREDFLRTNRDLINTFSILAQGEQLLRGTRRGAQELKQINSDLQHSQSEFFVEEEAAHSRLMDIAAAAKHSGRTEQLLQRSLLEELKVLPEVAELGEDELLSEYRELQKLALASYSSQPGALTDDTCPGDQKAKGTINREMEEYLLEQVCAAIAASVHGATSELLLEDAPPDYLCPISKQLMVQPVMLVETGHTYEAAAIHKWLATHDVCPLNGRKLSSKQTSPNYALKRLIADWAAAHSITLPRAPAYHTGGSDHNSYTGSGAAAATAAAVAASRQGSSYSSTQTTPGATIIIDMGDGTEGQKTGASTLCCCTRTRWAVGAIVVLLVAALGIGLGVGIPMVTRRSKGLNNTSANSGATIAQTYPANASASASEDMPSAATNTKETSPTLQPKPQPVASGPNGTLPTDSPGGLVRAASMNASDPFTVVVGVINKWADLDCGSKSLLPGKCQLCSVAGQPWSVSSIADACLGNPDCVAFILDEAAPCAYLMASNQGRTNRPVSQQYGQLGYCLNDRGADCTGEFTYHPRTDVKDAGDFSCPKLWNPEEPVCFIPSVIQTVAERCRSMAGCTGFVYTRSFRRDGGYLKNVTRPRNENGMTDLYVKVSKTATPGPQSSAAARG